MRYAIGMSVVMMLTVGLMAANPAGNLAGGCCYPDGDCMEDFEPGCLQTGGTWTEGAACSDVEGDCLSLAVAPCPWDCDDIQDGVVGVTDLLALLGQWTQVGTSCDFDFTGVDVVDLLRLLGNWGPCP